MTTSQQRRAERLTTYRRLRSSNRRQTIRARNERKRQMNERTA